MADGNVDSGVIGSLVILLGKKLGRSVVVHRTENKFKKPGSHKVEVSIRYSLAISGAVPEVYFGLTVNEVKGRLTMLIDLILCGVLVPIGESGTGPPYIIVPPTVAAALRDISPPADDPY